MSPILWWSPGNILHILHGYFSSTGAVIWLPWRLWYTCNSLRWRHNDHAGVSDHQPHGCLLNRLFRRKSKKTAKLRVAGICAGNSPGTGEFPAQMASYAENVSIWWRHHVWRIGVKLLSRLTVTKCKPHASLWNAITQWWHYGMYIVYALLAFCARNSNIKNQ